MSEEHIAALSARVSVLETRGAVDEVHRNNISERLSSIEDTLKWLVRLVMGGLVMAVLAFFLNGGANL